MILVRAPQPALDQAALTRRVIAACRDVIVEHEAYLCDLDCAIGDGDHGTNMRRGLEALTGESEHLATVPFSEAMIAAGTVLVMSIGGAAGPLYGTLLMEIGKGMAADPSAAFADVFQQAVAAVARRGKSSPGEKTLLDVLYPLSDALIEQMPLSLLAEESQGFANKTIDMKALRGRASFLGERSIGHMDPGAASCALLCATICRELVLAGAA
ncbi:dihydroxyacetone kinase subunit DhaL [Pararhizobium sp. BT-229]|uniref:dihydroxyacetone kinase subunit DhaL n=1 Tax=Pararhizobium sp. BT-229 TaxID=2986923 RepID=UPI0021F7F84F|nr:dihydroxyacetone kinase subunit DhaL [Pararhizobium sp. BT-229]MCV9966623.1 dihydroxyacetone kinase subunit DhaL [Pararhizobium sp. BT-229]